MNHLTDRLLRLPQVLELVPVSKSTWWLGVRDGRFPKPVKLGRRTTCWRESEILALFNRSADETPSGRESGSEKRDMAKRD